MKPVKIVGGGLAGLSLARALAQAGAPVTVYEKSHYPRHKVCGEFITGLTAPTRAKLDLDTVLDGALEHRSAAWFYRDRHLFSRPLPQPALGLSRWLMDERLAEAARRAGAEVIEGVGVRSYPEWGSEEGWLDTAGVSRGTSLHGKRNGWLGLKVHCVGYEMTADLELHLGHRAYAGMSRIEDGQTNVCMLMHASACRPGERRTLEAGLEAVGLAHLRKRLEGAEIVAASRTATAGLSIGQPRFSGQALALGDAAGMIPPFTGHGMAMAFESAAIALDPLLEYSRERLKWDEACAQIALKLALARSRKLRWASWIHPFLLHPFLQHLSGAGSKLPVFPWNLLYRLTH